MEYRKLKDTYYIRIDRGEEIISSLLDICRKEGVRSAVFTGIGGCDSAELQTFIRETGTFETELVEGTLELINVTGNIISDENDVLYHHTHALFSGINGTERELFAGHMKASTVLYTAEIELRPVQEGVIRRRYDPETGTGFWDLSGQS